MVGVPGKSKGCKTCRQRKIACDQKRPACTQCTRSNRECGGYQKERIFVLVQPDAEKTHTFIRPSLLKSTSCSRSRHHPRNTWVLKHDFASPAVSNDAQHEQMLLQFSETGSAYRIIQRNIERHNLVQLFLSQCLPQWSSLDPRSWVALLGDLPSTIDALELSSIAVSAAVVGRMIQNTNLVRESLTYYTLGLRQLQRALNKANLAQEDGTLAACMALSLYEALECPNSASKGYYEHCNGLMALIQIRGAHAHSLGAGHKLFLGVRIPGILHALNHNSSTILSEPIWMEQPWSILPKLPFDRVADCLAKAPGILNRVPLLFSLDPNQQLDLIRELVYQCLEIDMALKQIDDDLRLATSGDLYWPVSSKMKLNPLDDNHSGSNYFPITFNFIDLEIAKTLILLWATWTMLWSGLCNLYQHFDIIAAAGGFVMQTADIRTVRTSWSGGTAYLPSLEHRVDYLSMAHHVCQCVEYFLQDSMLLTGPLTISPALGIVIDALKNRPGHEEEICWLQVALKLVQQKGLRALEYVKT